MQITKENFNEYFFDTKKHEPKEGDVIAKFSATGEFLESREKTHIIDLLLKDGKILPAIQLMVKIHHAREESAIELLKNMIEDLMNGMTPEEVNKKPYKFYIEMFFYTKPEYIPTDDPHWKYIEIVKLNNKDLS